MLRLLPAATAHSTAHFARRLLPHLVNRGLDGDLSAGLDLKLHLTQPLPLDAAINPDFAQVEADQLIFNLNNYEIEYPEKRPLFLEGADLFATPLGIFYSRRIDSSPLTPTVNAGALGETRGLVDVPTAATIFGALRLVGRLGDAWTVGLLTAVPGDHPGGPAVSAGVHQTRAATHAFTVHGTIRSRGEDRSLRPGGRCPRLSGESSAADG